MFSCICVILIVKTYCAAFFIYTTYSMIADSYLVGISAQVFNHCMRTTKGRFCVYVPIFVVKKIDKLFAIFFVDIISPLLIICCNAFKNFVLKTMLKAFTGNKKNRSLFIASFHQSLLVMVLRFHSHVHCIVSGGGLALSGCYGIAYFLFRYI